MFNTRTLNQQKIDSELARESKINAAGYKVQRIHGEWVKCHRSRCAGDMLNLSFYLDGIWLELVSDSTPDQEKEYNTLKAEIERLFTLSKKHASQGNIKLFRYYKYLASKQVYAQWKMVTKIENIQGLGKAYKDKDYEEIF